MKKYIISVLLLFLFISCALESKFSLPHDEKINTELIGEWYNNDNNDVSITVVKHGKKTYKLLIKDTEETNELISYSKTIKGFEIMNIETEYNHKITNVFYGFKIKGNTLIFSEVNDKLIKKEFKSETELLDFFNQNITNKDFFINETELTRK